MHGNARAGALLAGFIALTLPLIPLQAALLCLPLRGRMPPARHFPNWYHRRLCRLLGVRLHVEGAVTPGVPTLLLANHVSWLDIPVLSAVMPVSFVAKREVSTWPMVRTLAHLQRTIFVDRERRHTVGTTKSEIEQRLAQGDAIVLFAEGTSSDGNRVLPFRSALIAAAGVGQRPAGGRTTGCTTAPAVEVRTLGLAYTHMHGMPLGRAQRPLVAWYGDMELPNHLWAMLASGPVDVHIRIGDPMPLDSFADRKVLARHSEAEVRRTVSELLRRAGAAQAKP